MADPLEDLHAKADAILELQRKNEQAIADLRRGAPVAAAAAEQLPDTTCAVCAVESHGLRICGRGDCPGRPECFRV